MVADGERVKSGVWCGHVMCTVVLMTSCPCCGVTIDEDASFCPRDGTPLDPLIGSVVGGDIVLTSLIGGGAMGRVYRGHQRGVGRDVAVKVLRAELTTKRHMVERFAREATMASKVQHPHVVEVYLSGTLDDGVAYIAMEYLDGTSLRAALDAAGGAFDVTRAIAIALQIADACGEAHARGVVHRDLKPDNVALVTRAGVADWVKVLDFGIAKSMEGELSAGSVLGAVFGTARYISPEGAHGGEVSAASDVYSLATMLYEMLAGRTPFDAECGLTLLVKQAHDAPPDLREVARDRHVPEAVAELVMANLAKDPALRAPDARAFGAALAAAAASSSSSPAPEPIAPIVRRRTARSSLVAGLMFLLGAATAGSLEIVMPIHAAQAAPASCHAASRKTQPRELARGHVDLVWTELGPSGADP